MRFSESTAWVWSTQAVRTFNNVVYFRRTFDVTAPIGAAELRLTADSRYEVFVNGVFVGLGPPRSWPSPWTVDRYPIHHLLHGGNNTMAVRVQHFGLGTFQYLPGEAGLIAELELQDAQGRRVIGSDSTWKALPCAAIRWPVPRISVQQGWEEQYDATRELRGWCEATFDDRAWPAACPVRRPGEGSHATFEPRDIPFLSMASTAPVRVMEWQIVKPAPVVWSLYPRIFFNAHDLSANFYQGWMLLASIIESPLEQEAQFHQVTGHVPWRLNGQDLKFDDRTLQETDSGVAHARLASGSNLLLARVGDGHRIGAQISVWTKQPVVFKRPGESTDAEHASRPWLAIGPCATPRPPGETSPRLMAEAAPEATPAALERLWALAALDGAELRGIPARPLTPDMMADDIMAITASDRPVAHATPQVESPQALLFDNPEVTVIYPSAAGDVRVLLDFGREIIGFHTLEIDAPAGTIVDNQNFEFIQQDGRKNLCEGMNNSFRYVCREGPQQYRTFVRRGFRYSWFTFRNFQRPVAIRRIGLLECTYPQRQDGDFSCSDPLLERIWHVGAASVRCCSEDTYTDCPTYEQTHWVGDARNEALVDLTVNGDARLSRHSWIQVGRSLERSDIVESHVPSAWQNILPAWSFLWMRWAQEHYWLTGEQAFAQEALGFLERQVAGIRRHINAQGLFEIEAWNMFDWAPMDTPTLGVVTHQNCLAVLGLRQAAMLAVAVGHAAPARRWRALADQLAQAINRYLWDQKQSAYVDCLHANGKKSKVFSQQTQTAAYISGVAQGRRKIRTRAIMRQPPKGFVKAGSPFFMFFALEGFVLEGRPEAMLQALRDYWGIQIDAGASTFWEMYYPDAERQTRSHCHGWSAAPTYFLSAYSLGVRPAAPGFAKVLVAPQPGNLRWAQGRVPSPHGPITCRWERRREAFRLDLALPKTMPVEIRLPVRGRVEVAGGGLKTHGSKVFGVTQKTRISVAIKERVNTKTHVQSHI